uniref:Cytochrome n=1 Tax=Lutzomyia longipalpis TaxID=7200 RepID=A0A1B0CMB4_LUTLO
MKNLKTAEEHRKIRPVEVLRLRRNHHIGHITEYFPLNRSIFHPFPIHGDTTRWSTARWFNPKRLYGYHLNKFILRRWNMRARTQSQQEGQQLRPRHPTTDDAEPNDAIIELCRCGKVTICAKMRLICRMNHHEIPLNCCPRVRHRSRQGGNFRCRSKHLMRLRLIVTTTTTLGALLMYTPMFGLEVLLAISLLILAFLWWWQRSARSYWEKHGVSYISGPPLIGALKEAMLFRQSFAELFSDLYGKFKNDPITGVYFFHKPSLIVRDPELIKRILVKDFQHFVDSCDFFFLVGISSDPVYDKIGRDGLFVAKGTQWKNIRNKVSPVFTTGKLKNFFVLMENVSRVLEQKLSSEIGQQESMEYEMKELATEFTTPLQLVSFGVEANCLINRNAEFNKIVRRSTNFTWRRAIEFTGCFLLPELATIFRFTVLSKEMNEFLRSTINYVLEERLKSHTKQIVRLYPPLPFLDRMCYPSNGEESYSLEPYHKFSIPKGMPIYIPIFSIHRDAKYFENPNDFIPERFSTENPDKVDQNSYLAFGTGPRNCIGLRFAYIQVKLALYTIIRDYRIEVCKKTPSRIILGKKSLMLQSEEPLIMNLVKI